MTGKYFIFVVLVILAAVIVTGMIYPSLPEIVPTHWNASGQVNGFSPKWMLFLFGPGMMAAIGVILYFLPWLSPRQFEVDSFRATYLQITLITIGMLAYLYGIVLWAAMGHRTHIDRAIIGGVCLLIAMIGNLMGKVRRNFFIGIRTPWALANDRVWNATHRFGAKTMVAAGVAGLIFVLIGLPVWFPFFAIMAGTLVPVIYSLVFYKQLERRGEL